MNTNHPEIMNPKSEHSQELYLLRFRLLKNEYCSPKGFFDDADIKKWRLRHDTLLQKIYTDEFHNNEI